MNTLNFNSIGDRLPPQNIEAEESILGGILLDPNGISRVADTLKAEAFSLETHKLLYENCLRQYRAGKSTDLLSIMTVLLDRKELDRIGGQSKLLQLVDRTVSAMNIDRYAELVMDKWQRRRLIAIGYKLAELGMAGNHIELEELFNQADALYYSVRNDTEIDSDRPRHINDVLAETYAELEELNAGEDAKPAFIQTGFYDLDAQIGGLPDALVTIAGRPGMGKSHFANELAIRLLMQGYPILFYALEMTAGQMARRLIVRDAAVRGEKIDILKMFKMNALEANDWDTISASLGSLATLPLYMQDRADVTATKIEADMQWLAAKEGKVGAVIVDYAQLMDTEESGMPRYQELDKLLKRLRGLSKKFRCPIIAFAQIGQHVEKQQDKRPTIADIRESAGFSQESAMILLLYRDEYYNPDSSDKGIMEIIVDKSRFSSGKTVKLLFEPEYGRFRNYKA